MGSKWPPHVEMKQPFHEVGGRVGVTDHNHRRVLRRLMAMEGGSRLGRSTFFSGCSRPFGGFACGLPFRRAAAIDVFFDEGDDVIAQGAPLTPRPGLGFLQQVFWAAKCGVPGHAGGSISLSTSQPWAAEDGRMCRGAFKSSLTTVDGPFSKGARLQRFYASTGQSASPGGR